MLDSPDKCFGVLPLGTHNHFAKELNVPLDLDHAIQALARGQVREIPVAEVNGRAFLNFSAIGIHPLAVEERDRTPSLARTLSKTLAMGLALLRVLIHPPVYSVRISSAQHALDRRTPSLIVCNNEYQMRAFGVEAASVPDRGLLNVYIADSPRPYNVIGLLLRAAMRLLRRETRHFTAVALREFRVDARWVRHMRVSIDGEVTTLALPLHYRIRPTSQRVLVPAEPTPPMDG
jgi:diacylglycerol kinase family enzyme